MWCVWRSCSPCAGRYTRRRRRTRWTGNGSGGSVRSRLDSPGSSVLRIPRLRSESYPRPLTPSDRNRGVAIACRSWRRPARLAAMRSGSPREQRFVSPGGSPFECRSGRDRGSEARPPASVARLNDSVRLRVWVVLRIRVGSAHAFSARARPTGGSIVSSRGARGVVCVRQQLRRRDDPTQPAVLTHSGFIGPRRWVRRLPGCSGSAWRS